ncbi:MAG: carbamoyltransferase [Anaerolineae bacterium]|jgi:carbamoyltransferase|nr:carbamoyltransferase [Anaerolineae bacterium]
MYILGISCFYHDAAAALIRDGELVAASMEERFSRKKHDNNYPTQAIEFCLRQAGIKAQDLDYVVFYEKPLLKFERILLTTLNTFPESSGVWREAILSWFKEKLWVKNIIQSKLSVDAKKVLFCDHHMSHAASAFFCSPFRDAAVLTVDGVGEWTTTTIGKASSHWVGDAPGGQNEITLFNEHRFPHSIGLLYSAFTAWLGFRVNNGEYKVMGMAPYGEPRYLDKMAKVFHQNPQDASFKLDLDYFSFHQSAESSFNQRFIDLFGQPRPAEADFFTMATNPERAGEKAAMAENQHYADVAASIQRVTEDALINIANHLHKQTGLKKLVMAGGVALNTKANYRILQETPFDEIYIQPAAGDDGGAVGAALWAYHVVLGKPRNWVMPNAYWGQSYSNDEVRAFLDSKGIKYDSYEGREDEMLDIIAEGLTKQKVVGFFQGRFEWGPRALGNRSILADPRTEEMKEVVNTKIKFREPFRPFAPVVLRDRAAEYFAYPDVEKHEAPRYMLMVSPIHEDKQDQLQAVCHMGTGRLQSIERETNPRYYGVIERFGQITGVPVILNTSFNLRGEPIVTSPRDAYNTFHQSDIDYLAMESILIRKP